MCPKHFDDLHQGVGSIDGQTVTVNIGEMPSGAVVTIFIETTVLESNITVNNTGCVTSDTTDDLCTVSNAIQLLQITELPETGETPWWRYILLGMIVIGGMIIFAGIRTVRQ